MSIFGRKKQREIEMAKTEKHIAEIRAEAMKAADLATRKAKAINKLIADANNDMTVKLYLAVNGREK